MDVRADLRRIERLSTTPELLLRLLEVLRDEKARRQDLEAAIERDQSLAHRIVAAANSAFFGHPGRVDSLEQAVLLLGFDMVRNLSLGMTVIRALGRASDERIRGLWSHAFDVAVAASELCGRVSVVAPGIGFLAGLLHDVGRVVLLSLYPTVYPELIGEPDLPVRERERFGMDHAEVGGLFLGRVPFPREIAAAVANHHRPEETPSDRGVVLSVALAESLTARLDAAGGRAADGCWDRAAGERMREAGLDEADLRVVEAALLAHAPERELFLGV